jgi:hypothetical protein
MENKKQTTSTELNLDFKSHRFIRNAHLQTIIPSLYRPGKKRPPSRKVNLELLHHFPSV